MSDCRIPYRRGAADLSALRSREERNAQELKEAKEALEKLRKVGPWDD